ncbi:hypothetical protein [Aeromonas hydrophila]|uniref:hypothetical protein n=1 Tax=Aeromonas hydrophila TaxID=644 RepID=UPI003D211D3E
MNELVIRSESDLYKSLSLIRNDELDLDGLAVRFDGWPIMSIHLHGEKFDSTITPDLMKAFIEMQSSIFRAYSLARYNSVQIRGLKQVEKDLLEIRVKVQPGSSRFEINLQEILENICHSMVGKMESKHLLIMVLGIAAIYGSNSAFNFYIENQKEVRLAEIKGEEQRQLIEQLKVSQEGETERLKVLHEIISEQPRLKTINQYYSTASSEILKRSGDASLITMQGVDLTGDVARELTKTERKKSNEIYLDGSYRILGVDSSKTGEFKVKLKNTSTSESFIATIVDEKINPDYIKLIQKAEWQQLPIRLHVNARESNGLIKYAHIVRAESIHISPAE